MNSNRNKTNILLLFLLGCVVTMSGCLQGSAVRTGNYYAPTPFNVPIDVYLDTSPETPVEEVGLVSAKGSGINSFLTDVIEVLQDQARRLGADAVLVTKHWTEVEHEVEPDGTTTTYRRVFAEGIAVRYL